MALSLLGDTKIVLLDEPTAGMDLITKRQIWIQIMSAMKDKLIIVATHDM